MTWPIGRGGANAMLEASSCSLVRHGCTQRNARACERLQEPLVKYEIEQEHDSLMLRRRSRQLFCLQDETQLALAGCEPCRLDLGGAADPSRQLADEIADENLLVE